MDPRGGLVSGSGRRRRRRGRDGQLGSASNIGRDDQVASGSGSRIGGDNQVGLGSNMGGGDQGGDTPDSRVHRTLYLNYQFDSRTGRGDIDESGLPLFVNHVGHRHPKSSAIVHKNYLPILVDPSTDVLYHDFTIDLRSYVGVAPKPLVCGYRIPSFAKNEQKIEFNFIDDIYRRFFRGVIKFIVFLHHQWNLSLASLDLDQNFVVHENNLKLCRLEFVDCTCESRTNDFILLARVLNELFGTWEEMPREVQHLCRCMCSYSDMYEGEYNDQHTNQGDHVLLINHLAVLKTTKRIDQIKNFFEKAELADYHSYENVFREMLYNEDWTLRFKDRDPGLGPAQAVYDKMEEESQGSYDLWNGDKYSLNCWVREQQ